MQDTFKYNEGEKVICTSLSPNNPEGLKLSEIYIIVGKSIHDGNHLYAVRNNDGKIIYTMDRFERVALNHEIKAIKAKAEVKDDKYGEVDMVNSPPHYKKGGIEVIDYIKAKLSHDEYRGYLHGSTIKYISRVGSKWNDKEDLQKSNYYANKFIDLIDKDEEYSIPKITNKQRGYIAGLTKELKLERTDLPKWLCSIADYHELTEVEASELIDKLIVIQQYQNMEKK